MRRKIILLFFITIILSLVTFLGYKAYKTSIARKNITTKIALMPNMPFYFPKGLVIEKNKKIVVNYFSPSCEHCQYMANQLAQYQHFFKNIQVLMISPARKSDVDTFIKSYGLDTIPHITIGIDTAFQFYTIFGTATIPSFFIYDVDKKFVKQYIGETKIENIIQ